MRRLTGRSGPQPGEPALALINVVFLLLVFVLIAGSLAPRREPGLRLVALEAPTGPPAAALVLTAEGRLLFRGAEVSPEAAVADWPAGAPLHLMADRDAPAARLAEVAQALAAAGAAQVVLIGEPRR